MIPIKIFTVFKGEKDADLYIESANVVSHLGEYIAKEKKPASLSELILFKRAYEKGGKKLKMDDKPFENVFYVNMETLFAEGISDSNLEMVWLTYPEKQQLYFPKGYSIKTGTYQLPTLIWSYRMNRLSVGALLDKQPSLSSQVYFSPLLNVYDSLQVCAGSTNYTIDGSKSVEEAKANIVKGFFKSEFNQFHVDPFKDITKNEAYQVMQNRPLAKKHFIKTKFNVNDLCLSIQKDT